MRRSVLVVAGWAGFNALLVALLAGFAGASLVVVLYAASVLLIAGVALVVMIASRRNPGGGSFWRPAHGDVVPLAAVAGLIFALGIAFNLWLILVAAAVGAAAAVLAASAGRRSRA